MKRLLFIALGIICYHVVTFAQEVKVEVRGIRSAKGAIMVMAQQDSESKPVYAMATAVKDTVTVVLKDVPCINGKTKCSVFTKHFVRNLALLTQNKMCILLQKK